MPFPVWSFRCAVRRGALAEISSKVDGQALIAQEPLDPASYINYSRFLVSIGELAEAQNILETGRNKANPSSNLLVELAEVYEARDRMSKAEAAARDAVALDPDNARGPYPVWAKSISGWDPKEAGVECLSPGPGPCPGRILPRVRLVNGLMDIGET